MTTDVEAEPRGATTPTYSLPYPVPSDPADVPADMQRLAVAVEALPPLGFWASAGAGNIRTTSFAWSERANLGDAALGVRKSGNAAMGWYADASGAMRWSDGASYDTTLYRYGVNVLKTDSGFIVGQRLYLGTGVDTSLYRAYANAIATDGDFNAAGSLYASGASSRLYFGTTADVSLYRATGLPFGAGGIALQSNQALASAGAVVSQGAGNTWTGLNLVPGSASSPNTFFGIYYDGANNRGSIGALSGGVAYRDVLVGESANLLANKILLGTSNANFDTDLYRFSAGFLMTAGNFGANAQAVGQVTLQAPGGLPTIFFGSAQDTNLYRSAVGTLKTDGAFVTGQGITAGGVVSATPYFVASAGPTQTAIGDVSLWTPGGVHAPGVIFGDSLLYRAAAQQLRTDAQLIAGGSVLLNTNGGIYFGTAFDTSLYRSGANALKTDGSFASGSIVLSGSGMTIAGDTNLYRYGANQLATAGPLLLGASTAQARWTVSGADATTRPQIRAANTTSLADANGNARVNFTEAFPSTCVAVVAVNADTSAGGPWYAAVNSVDPSGFNFRVMLSKADGALVGANYNVRVTYIAYGY